MGWPTDKAVRSAARALENPDMDWSSGPASVARLVLRAAGLPELVGARGVIQILDARSPNLDRVKGLPEHVYDLPTGKLWLREEIEAFAPEYKQRPTVANRRAKSRG
jgi:hypothetical protein